KRAVVAVIAVVSENKAEERGDRDRGDEAHDDSAAVREKQTEVLADQGTKGSHHESRSFLPVSVRKTVSRSGRSVTRWVKLWPRAFSHARTRGVSAARLPTPMRSAPSASSADCTSASERRSSSGKWSLWFSSSIDRTLLAGSIL